MESQPKRRRVCTRKRVANARVVGKDPTLLDSYIDKLRLQQEEAMARSAEREEYQLTSEYYGASGTYTAASLLEALVQMEVREESGNKVTRSGAYNGSFPMR